jgi:hypothetical protein
MGSFLLELWQYMKSRGKLWMMPIFVIFIVVGGLIVFTQGSAVAPFIYTLF